MKYRTFLLAGALGILPATVSGCDRLFSPLELSSEQPDALPTAPIPEPGFPAVEPGFPAVPDNAVTYYRISPSLIPGQSRYVLAEDGRFSLQYVIWRQGVWPELFIEYPGTYSRTDSMVEFEFDGWSIAGSWLAEGTLRGDSLTVTYNLVMSLSDFEDGVYLRSGP